MTTTDQPNRREAMPRAFPPVPGGRDRADLDRFWSDWEPLVRRIAARSLQRADVPDGWCSVDDAVQHVYLELLEQWPQVREPGRFALGAVLRPYIFAQIRHLRRCGSGGDGGIEPVADEPSVEDRVVEEQLDALLIEALRAALPTLPDKQRRAIELTIAEGRSRDAAAETMGIAVGTVSAHRARGLAKLRQRLTDTALTGARTVGVVAVVAAGVGAVAAAVAAMVRAFLPASSGSAGGNVASGSLVPVGLTLLLLATTAIVSTIGARLCNQAMPDLARVVTRIAKLLLIAWMFTLLVATVLAFLVWARLG